MDALYLPEFDACLRYFDLEGEPPVRVYLHGLCLSAATLIPTATHSRLRASRSILVDLFGFGFSDRPERFGYTLEDHARTVALLLDALRIADCDVIGHSSGGSIAIVLAALRPDLVGSLTVAEANLDPGMGPFTADVLRRGESEYVNEGVGSTLEQLRTAIREDPDSSLAPIVEMIALSSPLATYRTARSLTEDRRPTLREQLVGLGRPRAFLVGSRTLEADEKPASGEAGEGLDCTGVRRLIVPDAGHVMMYDNPPGFAQAIAQAVRVSGS
jgi:pimeloyl-ACP methyl ester carboxylesterase